MRDGAIILMSGGQTGVDRAALDVALELGLPTGGWCPRGRRAEDGMIPDRYPLRETPSAIYRQRTTWNVRDTDGALVLLKGTPAGGTALTITIARRLAKPLLVVDLDRPLDPLPVRQWLEHERIRTINVAGPRESSVPGVYDAARRFLRAVFSEMA